MPLDESIVYYWTSLGLSAAAVLVFLWLLREPAARKAGVRPAERPAPEAGPLSEEPASRPGSSDT
ncbi:MAG: hypothetical protein ABI592_14495 [Acidobacteriota bacterium]